MNNDRKTATGYLGLNQSRKLSLILIVMSLLGLVQVLFRSPDSLPAENDTVRYVSSSFNQLVFETYGAIEELGLFSWFLEAIVAISGGNHFVQVAIWALLVLLPMVFAFFKDRELALIILPLTVITLPGFDLLTNGYRQAVALSASLLALQVFGMRATAAIATTAIATFVHPSMAIVALLQWFALALQNAPRVAIAALVLATATILVEGLSGLEDLNLGLITYAVEKYIGDPSIHSMARSLEESRASVLLGLAVAATCLPALWAYLSATSGGFLIRIASFVAWLVFLIALSLIPNVGYRILFSVYISLPLMVYYLIQRKAVSAGSHIQIAACIKTSLAAGILLFLAWLILSNTPKLVLFDWLNRFTN